MRFPFVRFVALGFAAVAAAAVAAVATVVVDATVVAVATVVDDNDKNPPKRPKNLLGFPLFHKNRVHRCFEKDGVVHFSDSEFELISAKITMMMMSSLI